MKTKNLKKILVLAVSVLYALVGLVTGGLFFGVQNASAAVQVLDAIKGYGEIEAGKYSYIYFGEYPQRRVLEVTNGTGEGKTGWETFPNFCPDSMYVEETIKGYIAELNEQYYNKYLLSLPTTDETRVAVETHLTSANATNSTTTTLGTYDWENSTIYTFYPQQNFETKNLYFDYDSGYYTLKTNVVYPNSATNKTPGAIAYPAGTKFHTYNHAVDSANKYYGYIADGETEITRPAGYNDNTLVTSTTDLHKRANDESSLMDINGKDTISFNTAKSGETYLYVVEPIKWRVLSVSGTTAFLLSENNIDSISFSPNLSYRNEWAHSNVRVWLNGKNSLAYYHVGTNHAQNQNRTLISSSKSFINMAFNENEQTAILDTPITQDGERSFYNYVWHYYEQPTAGSEKYTTYSSYTGGATWDFTAPIEDRPTTTDKIFSLSYTDVQNTAYGFVNNGLNAASNKRIAYNTDYAIATGSMDSRLSGTSESNEEGKYYSQNTDSGYGGIYYLRTASYNSYGQMFAVNSGGSVLLSSCNTFEGVRPAMNIDLSKVNVASLMGNTQNGWRETDGIVPSQNGTADSPIALDYASQTQDGTKVNTSVAYSMGENTYASVDGELVAGTDATSIANKKGGSWQVESAEKIESGTNAGKYRHIIKVNYNDQPAGSYLVARVVNATSGSSIAMAPITTTLVNSSTPDNNTSTYFVSGSTHFQIITDSATANYKVIVYSSLNSELQSAGIYPHIDGNINSSDVGALLQNYTDNGNAFDYIYFGEYPNTSVARKITSTSATDGYNGGTTYGTFTTDSVNISNLVLGLIDALNDSYYNTYLKSQTESAIYKNLVAEKGAYPFATTAYNWLSTEANSQGILKNDSNLTVEYFYPLEDYEDSSIFFDFESGYYTLKTDVTSGAITYKTGAKFHTYNNVVDVYQKYGTYYNANTGNQGTSYGRLPTSIVTGDYVGLSNINNWKADFGDGQGSVTFNWAKAGSTYLFEVEPIKWRVLDVSGSNITVMADDIVDSIRIQNINAAGNEWQYSLARMWLNDIDKITTYDGHTVYNHYSGGRTFIDMAFSSQIQKALVGKTHSQEADGSCYDYEVHYYTQEGADEKGKAVEARPTTTDKVWFLSEDEAIGENAFSGFISSAMRRAYNSDYSIVTGNEDAALEGGYWWHNIRDGVNNQSSNNGGFLWLRTANYPTMYSILTLTTGGNRNSANVSVSQGVRPALVLDLSKLNLSSVAEGDSVANGNVANPINASSQLNGGVSSGKYYVYSTDYASLSSVKATGHWRAVTVGEKNAENKYPHTIEVNYYGLKANGYLNVKITDKNGVNVAFATFASGASATDGTTCFVFDAPTNKTGDYIIEILEGVNGNLTATDIYEKTADGVYGATGTIWLDPVLGDDRNSGLLEAYPIASIERAMLIAGKNCVIILKNTIKITSDTTIDFGAEKNVTIKRWYVNKDFYFSGNMFEVGVWNDGLSEEANKANRVNLTLNNVTVTGDVHADFRYYYGSLFTINNAKVIVNDGFKAENSWINFVNRDTAGGVFYVRNSDLTINGGEFSNINLNAPSTFGSSGAAVCATGSSNIVVNGGKFEKCVAYYGGAIYCDNIESLNILGGYFDQNKVNYGCIEVRNTKNVVISNIKVENTLTRTNNNAYYGAISLRRNSIASISNCEFVNNVMFNSGGAIGLNNNSDVTISNCTFTGNKSTNGNGGAIYAADSNLELIGCNFTANEASGNGGAIQLSGKEAKIIDCKFKGNLATGSTSSGGAFASTKANLKFENCEFYNNKQKSQGGAIYTHEDVGNGLTLEVLKCKFVGNGDPNRNMGGAIHSFADFNTIKDSEFVENKAYHGGGAIAAERTLNIDNCYFASNSTAVMGGAISTSLSIWTPTGAGAPLIYYYYGAGCSVNISNSIFENNSTGKIGGALLLKGAFKTVENCIFKNNTASVGGAIAGAHDNTVDIIGCSFEGNSATDKFSYITENKSDATVYIASGGGAVAMLGPTLNVDNCNFNNNSATGGGSAGNGGAIFTSKTCKNISVLNSNFVGNSANYDGGAVSCLNNNNEVGKRNFEDCYFEGNFAGNYGGGIRAAGRIYDNLEFYTNCSFVNNRAYYGGGLVTQEATVDGGCFYRNKASYGGAIHNAIGINVKNTIIEYNYASVTGSAFWKSSNVYFLDNVTIKNNFAKTGWAIDGYNSIVFDSENINIYNNYNNLKDGANNPITDPQNLILDGDGNIVANKDAKLANISNSSGKAFAYRVYKLLNSKVSFTYKTTEIEDDLAIIYGIRLGTFDISCITLDYAEEMGVELYFAVKPDDPDGYYAVFVKHVNQSGVINYVASSYNGVYDNEYHTIDIEVFGLTNYKIEYGLTTSYEYGETAPMFKDATLNGSGEVEAKTVYFKITASGKTAVEGTRGVRIEKNSSVSKVGTPVITGWIGFTIYSNALSNRTLLNDYISGVYFIDEKSGNVVTGDYYIGELSAVGNQLVLNANNLSSLGNTGTFVFKPHNPNYSEYKNSFYYVKPQFKIEYDNLWYLNGVFYPEDPSSTGADGKVLSNSASTYAYKVTDGQNGVDLNTMISFIKPGGTLTMDSSYVVANGKTVNVTTTKELMLTRTANTAIWPIFTVEKGGTLNIVSDGDLLTINGRGSNNNDRCSILLNRGKLNVSGNLKIINNLAYVNSVASCETKGYGGAIYNDTTGEAVFDGITSYGFIVLRGGFAYNLGKLTIKNCNFDGDLASVGIYITATEGGGVIYSAGELFVFDTYINLSYSFYQENYTTGEIGGGAIYTASGSKLEMYGTVIKNARTNYLSNGSDLKTTSLGGGLFIGEGATAYLEDCEITGCKAYSGGGIYVEGKDGGVGGSLTLINTKVDNNSLVSNSTINHGNGGGIYAGENTTVVINGGSVSGNTAYSYNETTPSSSWEYVKNRGRGGAVYILSGTLLVDNGTKITNNNAANGGAIYMHKNVLATFNYCLISQNCAKYYLDAESPLMGIGAAIYTIEGGQTINLNKGCEISSNTVGQYQIITIRGDVESILNIDGAEIINNTIITSGELIGLTNVVFNFYSGKVCYNTSQSYNFRIYSSVCNMYGGEVSYNSTVQYGAGFRIESGTIFNMYGGEISYNDSRNRTGQGVGFNVLGAKLLIDGGKVLYNSPSGGHSGSNIKVTGTDSTLTIKSGQVLCYDKNFDKDIYIAGGENNTNTQLYLYGGEVDSIYIANRIGTSLGGKVIINDKISFKPWTGGEDSEGTMLEVTRYLLPGSKLPIQRIKRSGGTEGGSFFLSYRSVNFGYLDYAKIEAAEKYITFRDSNGVYWNFSIYGGPNPSYCYYSASMYYKPVNTLYFKPVSGDDSKVGTDAANAVKTWGEVVSLAKETGISTVYLLETWALSNGDNFDGNGLTIVRDSSLTTSMITLASGATATINNFVIDGNNVAGSDASIDNNGTLTIDKCVFKNCKNASGYGGAVCNLGTLTVKNSTFEANMSNYGGAIYSGGGSTLNVDNCVFEFNKANNKGGAFCLMALVKNTSTYLDVNAAITNSIFKNNSLLGGSDTTMAGGAIYAKGDTPAGSIKVISLTISGCEFENNSATTSDKTKVNYEGGAVYVLYSYLTVTNSKFANNTALGRGGAIRSYNAQTRVDGCEFINNRCDSTTNAYGGAVEHQDSRIYGFEIKNSNCVGNYASMHGTALYIDSIGKVLVDNCLFDASYNASGSLVYINETPVNVTVNDEVPGGTEPYYDVEVTNSTFENSKSSYVFFIEGKSQRTKFENLTFANNEGASEVIRSIGAANSTSKILYRNIKFENNKNGKIFHISAHNQATSEENVFDGITVDYFSGSAMFDLRVRANYTYKINNLNAKISSGDGIHFTNGSNYTSAQSNLNVYISNSTFDGLNKSTDNLIQVTCANIVEINNCYIKNKVAAANSQSSGVIVSRTNKLTMNNCYITNCHSGSYAGGAYIVCPSTINNCYFENNTASTNGGAIYFNSGEATLNGCYFKNNTTVTAGGAIYSTQNLNINHCHFYNNSVKNGSTVTTSADGYGGGAIYTSVKIDIRDSIFESNSSNAGGGAVNQKTEYFTCENTVFLKNSAYYIGGAVYNGGREAKYINCVFEGNETTNSRGGAIAKSNLSSYGQLIVLNSKFVNNKALTYGSALYSLCSVILDNNLFEGNTGGGTNDGSVISVHDAPSDSKQNLITNCRFINNDVNGSIIVVMKLHNTERGNNPVTIIQDTIISGNNGSNILLLGYGTNGNMFVDRCKIINNTATHYNGFFDLQNGTGIFELYNSEICGNSMIYSEINPYGAIGIKQGYHRIKFVNSNIHDNITKNEKTNYSTYGLFHVKNGELILDGCNLSNNTYYDNALGTWVQNSIYVESNGYVYMRDTVISNKNSTGYNASGNGVVYIAADAEPCVMVGCEIENGDYGTGSAIVNRGTLSMVDTYAHGNVADNGAVVSNFGILNISGENTRFVGNVATNKGGAILNNAGGRLTVALGEQAGVFEGNRANCGGAIYNAEGANLTISSGTFRGNEAVASADGSMFGNGAAIYNLGNLTINDGLFEGNTAQNGGGLYNIGTATINNGIFKKNYITVGGGGIYNATETVDGTTYVGNLVVNYALITENTVKSGHTEQVYGLGIANSANLTMLDGEISKHNFTSSDIVRGGGLYAMGGGIANIFGGEFVNNRISGGGCSIYVDKGSVVNVTDASFKANGGFVDIYIKDATANIINCKITSTGSINRCDLIYCTGIENNVVIKGCEFYNMRILFGRIINIENSDNILVENCYFYNNEIANYSTLLQINENKTVKLGIIVNGCVFESNIGTADSTNIIKVYNSGSTTDKKIVIQNCLFKNNSLPGVTSSGSVTHTCIIQVSWNWSILIDNNIFINNFVPNSSICSIGNNSVQTPIINCEFKDNISKHIFALPGNQVKYTVGIGLYGNNIITNNRIIKSVIYFSIAYEWRVQVGFGGKLIIEDNFLCDADGNYLDISGNITTDSSKYVQSNIEISSTADKKLGLFGGLAEGSRVGVHIEIASGSSLYNGYVVGLAVDANNPITTSDVEKLFYDNNEYGLALRGGSIVLVSPSDVTGDKIFVNDKVYLVDGEFKALENSDFEVYKNSVKITDFKVLYADDEAAFNAGEFSETSPKFASLGEYSVWYKIVDSTGADLTKQDGSAYAGVATIKLVKHVLTLVEAPIARISKGESLANATFVGGKVMSNGYEVAGTWAFNDADTVPTDNVTKYALSFVASAENIYANTVATSVAVEWLFESVVYKAVSGVNSDKPGFFVDSKFTGISLLSEIMPLMANNGTIKLYTTYVFTEDEVVTANNTIRINEATNHVGSWFEISNESAIEVTIGGGVGKIIFDGSAKALQGKLFDNNSTLNLGSNVVVYKFTGGGNNGAMIRNDGTLNVNGASFRDYYYYRSEGVGKGGVFYNTSVGLLNINSGNFVKNGIKTSNLVKGFETVGAVVYNDGGVVTISGGTYSNNYCNYGAGGVICNNGGNVDINGGVFNKNNAAFGGVICNKGGTVVFGGGTMLFNTASVEGAVVYNDESDADQTKWGEIVYNGSEMLKNSILGNGEFDSQVVVGRTNLWAIVFAIAMVALVGAVSGIILHKHLKGKRK